MSGGAFGYMAQRLLERGEDNKNIWKLMSVLEHELDWGLSCDTCPRCAKLRCIEAIIQYFYGGAEEVEIPCSIARDEKQNRCEKCERERPL